MKSKINAFRRSLMRRLTQGIGKSNFDQNVNLSKRHLIQKVLISRPNHRLGNLLLITPLVQEVSKTFPNCKIDLFVKGTLASLIFKNYSAVDRIIQLEKKPFKNIINYLKGWIRLKKKHYDIVINVSKNSSSGKLSTQFSNASLKFHSFENEEVKKENADYSHMAKYPVYNFRFYANKFGIHDSKKPIPVLDLKLSTDELENGKINLQKISVEEKKTICIFTYATGTKCYSESWWTAFYEQLKSRYSNYTIIEILPIENVSQIVFKAPTFYSKNIREIASVIANCQLFIGADSGMMHLASASLTTTIGLFWCTNHETYEPYGNNSFAINTSKGSLEDLFKQIDPILLLKK